MIDGIEYVDRYFNTSQYRLSQHHLESYNNFINVKIPDIIRNGNSNFVNLKTNKSPPAEFRIEITDLVYKKPTIETDVETVCLLPNMCRALGMSYSLSLVGTIVIHVLDVSSNTTHDISFPDTLIATIPLMLHSDKCYLNGMSRDELVQAGEDPDDPGGYFITWGAEKVIITQERAASNVPMLTHKSDGSWTLGIRSAPIDDTVIGITSIFSLKKIDGKTVAVLLPGRFNADVDVAVLFRALGVESDKEIVGLVAPGDNPRDRAVRDVLRDSLLRCHDKGIFSQADAIAALAPVTAYGSDKMSMRSDPENKRGKTHAMYILRKEFLAGIGEDLASKSEYMGRLLRRLILASLEMEDLTDRECMRVKRYFTSGMLLSEVFSEAYADYKSQATNALDRAWFYGPWRGTGDIRHVVNAANVNSVFSHKPITSVLQSSMRGNWGKHGVPEEGGIVQDLARLSWLQFLSHIRRTNNPLDRDLKITEPHYLHSTQWGCLCPVESPDGANVGLTNNLALLCEITLDSSPGPVVEFAKKNGCRELKGWSDRVVVHINGIPMFDIEDPEKLVKKFVAARRSGRVHRHTSIRLDIPKRELHILTDGGRCTRPLRIRSVEDPKSVSGASWDSLCTNGPLEYIDVDEAENTLVAWNREESSKINTHIELHMTAGMSVYAVTQPFTQHNPAPRNVLGAQQGKQAAGVYTTSWRSRIDTMGMVLNYPQVPLVHNRYEKTLAMDSHPGGFNSVVAIMCLTGFNMEDAVLVNKSALDRGLFGMTYLKHKVDEEDTTADGVSVVFGTSDGGGALQNNGLPIENRPVIPGDPLIGKLRKTTDGDWKESGGDTADEKWVGYVTDKVLVHHNASKSSGRVCKIRYRKLRSPKPGDKLASRHGQKGVIGVILPETAMPFTEEGIIPDLIVNPHAIPSRMTLGQFLDCLGSKAACVNGERVDGTAFTEFDTDALRKVLRDSGYEENCNEVMYAGSSGNSLNTDIFIGPTYYQRLKQMVEDKINYRGNKGARDAVTMQPVGGRARGGGLRIGEMENNGIMAHGIMGFATESVGTRSDRATQWYDGEGVPAVFNEEEDMFEQAISTSTDKRFVKHMMPRALIAMQHELAGMGIGMRMLPTEGDEQVYSEHISKTCGLSPDEQFR